MESHITAIVYVWTVTLVSDELRAIATFGLRKWWSNSWNRVDFISYLNTGASAFLRTWDDSDLLLLSRYMFALGALLLWLRGSRMYGISSVLGPKLMMIKTMMSDVATFVKLLLVVLIGYGVAMHAILEPKRTFDRQSINTILYKPTFNAIGETFLEQLQDKTPCIGEDFTQCSASSQYLVLGLLVCYLIISNILLVNLLIAMMASTYTVLDKNSNEIWSQQYIELLVEFRDLVPLPPPLNLVYNAVSAINSCVGFVFGQRGNRIGPNLGTKEEILVDPSCRMTAEDIRFVEEVTAEYAEEEKNKDKEEGTRTLIKDLVNKRMGAIDNKLKDLEYQFKKHFGDSTGGNRRRTIRDAATKVVVTNMLSRKSPGPV